ncbi:MAG TPA: hypothetical protein VG078_07090 [Acidimicrobiales bacterium]|nr:hypothetical protein [Acidimicrobiales bacterium]
MDLLAGAICVMCSRGVHWEAGRVACDGCDLPTDCCLCDPVPAPSGSQRSNPGR